MKGSGQKCGHKSKDIEESLPKNEKINFEVIIQGSLNKENSPF